MMRIEYSIRVLKALSCDNYSPVDAVSEETQFSRSLIEKTLVPLKKKKLVRPKKGKKGGYMLTKPFETITVDDILEAIDERDVVLRALASRAKACKLTELLESM